MADYKEVDSHSADRVEGRNYFVETVSLTDLLVQHGAPRVIDYLSIDTEGSEFEILRHFDFSRFSFRAISIEHNFSQNREKILSLMEERGYRRVFENVSDFDDWFVPGESFNS